MIAFFGRSASLRVKLRRDLTNALSRFVRIGIFCHLFVDCLEKSEICAHYHYARSCYINLRKVARMFSIYRQIIKPAMIRENRSHRKTEGSGEVDESHSVKMVRFDASSEQKQKVKTISSVFSDKIQAKWSKMQVSSEISERMAPILGICSISSEISAKNWIFPNFRLNSSEISDNLCDSPHRTKRVNTSEISEGFGHICGFISVHFLYSLRMIPLHTINEKVISVLARSEFEEDQHVIYFKVDANSNELGPFALSEVMELMRDLAEVISKIV